MYALMLHFALSVNLTGTQLLHAFASLLIRSIHCFFFLLGFAAADCTSLQDYI